AADVSIEGFGLCSRLVAGPELDAPVFDVTNAANVSFRSFAIFQRSGQPAFRCEATQSLTLEDMVVVSRVVPGARPAIEVAGLACDNWRIEDSVLIGASCISGDRLTASRICGSLLAAVERGIDVTDLLDVVVRDNRFAGVLASAEKQVEL